jgi:hypothetical protein
MAINKSQTRYCRYHVKTEFAKQQRERPLDSSSRSSTDISMPEAKAATTVKNTLRQQDRLPFGKQQSTSSFGMLFL